jgi:hypothetical protein
MFFVFSASAKSPSNINELFEHRWHDKNPLVVLHYKAGDIKSIHSAKLVFLSSEDCKTGYISHYQTVPVSRGFSIKVSQDFALLAPTTYLAALSVMKPAEISLIHSVLIRFHGGHQELPRFLTGCSDESVNCCISVECSNEAGACLPKYQFPRQSFILFREYEAIHLLGVK